MGFYFNSIDYARNCTNVYTPVHKNNDGKECRHIHAFSNAVVLYNKYDITSRTLSRQGHTNMKNEQRVLNTVEISPPSPPPNNNGPSLNECIFVLVNASAHLFQHFSKELVLQQDFKE